MPEAAARRARTRASDPPAPSPLAVGDLTALEGPGPDARAVAAAVHDLAAAVREHTVQRQGADEFFKGAAHRLDALCAFLRRKGPWLLASAPVVLTLINGVSPEVAERLSKVLAVWFGQ